MLLLDILVYNIKRFKQITVRYSDCHIIRSVYVLVLCHTPSALPPLQTACSLTSRGRHELTRLGRTACHVTPWGALGCAPAERGGGGGGVEFGCFA